MTATREVALEPDYRCRPDAQGRLLSRQDPIIDIVLVAVPFAALPFNLIIGLLTVVLLIATVAAFGVLRHERATSNPISNWPGEPASIILRSTGALVKGSDGMTKIASV